MSSQNCPSSTAQNLGFGRIVVLETEVPSLFVNPVKEDERWCKATMRPSPTGATRRCSAQVHAGQVHAPRDVLQLVEVQQAAEHHRLRDEVLGGGA